MLTKILNAVYLMYVITFMIIGVSDFQFPTVEHGYIVLITFGSLTYLMMTTTQKEEQDYEAVLIVSMWRKNFTYMMASGAAVMFSGILMMAA